MKSRTSASDRKSVPLTAEGARDADPDRDLEPDDEGEFWTPRSRGAQSAAAQASDTRAEPSKDAKKPAVRATTGQELPWFLRSRRRGTLAVALVLVVLAAIYGVSTFSPVRTVLRQSFTPISSPDSQFYLNGNPWVSGRFLNVPLGIIVQGAPNRASYKVHVWAIDHAGKTDAATTFTLSTQGGKGTANFSLPIPVDAQLVWAQVEGTSLAVHYRFAGSPLPSASPSASASGGRNR